MSQPKVDAQRDTVWQQAEQSLGSAVEARRLVTRLSERMYTRGEPLTALAEAPALVPTRPGFIGVLDDITNELAVVNDLLQRLLQQMGEANAAPTNVTGEAVSPGRGRW